MRWFFFVYMANSYQLPDLEGKTTTQRAAGASLLADQQGQTSNFLQKYSNTIANQGSTADMAGRISSELNLPQLRETSKTLNQRMLMTPLNNMSDTRGSNVTQNQLNNLNTYDLNKLAIPAQLAEQNTQTAENSLNTRLGYAQNDWNRQLLPLNSEQSFLSDRLARETSMFSEQNQNELNAMIQKMNAGITLSEGEKNRAQSLAIAEKGYESALKVAQSGSQFQKIGADGLYNTNTNKFAVRPSLASLYHR